MGTAHAQLIPPRCIGTSDPCVWVECLPWCQEPLPPIVRELADEAEATGYKAGYGVGYQAGVNAATDASCAASFQDAGMLFGLGGLVLGLMLGAALSRRLR